MTECPAADAAATAGSDPRAELETLASELEAARAEVQSYVDHLKRLQAEFDNFRKRTTREREELVERGGEPMARALLEVLDSFDRALEAEPADLPSFVDGVRQIRRQLVDALGAQGLKPLPDPKGSPMDPRYHEAVAAVPSSDHEAQTVIQEVQRGYEYRGRVIRPAKVVVAVRPPTGP